MNIRNRIPSIILFLLGLIIIFCGCTDISLFKNTSRSELDETFNIPNKSQYIKLDSSKNNILYKDANNFN